MPLRDSLSAIGVAFESGSHGPTRALMEKAGLDLAASGIVKTALAAGARAPLFDLPDISGNRVSLARLIRRGPVIISFYRGDWCPYCLAELEALSGIVDTAAKLGATLIAVSPQTAEALRPDTGLRELGFPVLTDRGGRMARAYGVSFKLPHFLRPIYTSFGHPLPRENGSDWILPVPASFVLDRGGQIVLAHVDTDYRIRLEPADLTTALACIAARKKRVGAPIPHGNDLYAPKAPGCRALAGANAHHSTKTRKNADEPPVHTARTHSLARLSTLKQRKERS